MINSAKIEFTLDLCTSQGYTYMIGQRTIKYKKKTILKSPPFQLLNEEVEELEIQKVKKAYYIVWILLFLFLAV